MVRRRAALQIDEIDREVDHGEEIKELESQMLRHSRPMVFSGDKNREIIYEKNFVGCCIAIAQNLNMDAKVMTVMEYYRALEVLEEQQKQYKKR